MEIRKTEKLNVFQKIMKKLKHKRYYTVSISENELHHAFKDIDKYYELLAKLETKLYEETEKDS